MPGRPPARSKPRLLLVEDHFSLCAFLYELLEEDYDVEVTTHGEQAWAATQREAFALVLASVSLPVLDGVDLTRRLRAEASTAMLPIILLTASNDERTLRRIKEGGADDFLLKPFRPRDLLECLRSHLGREYSRGGGQLIGAMDSPPACEEEGPAFPVRGGSASGQAGISGWPAACSA